MRTEHVEVMESGTTPIVRIYEPGSRGLRYIECTLEEAQQISEQIQKVEANG